MGVKKKRSNTGKAGLTNLGATCYMNSIVQSLFLSDDFRDDLMATKFDISKIKISERNKDITVGNTHSTVDEMAQIVNELQRIFAHLELTKRQAVNTRPFVTKLPKYWTPTRQVTLRILCVVWFWFVFFWYELNNLFFL